MAEPRLRFKREDGTAYPELRNATMGDFYTERNERGGEGLPMLTVSIHSGVSDGELDEDELGKRVKRSADPTMYKKAVSGDLAFNMMRAWQGAVGCVKTTGMVSPAYIVAEPNGEVDPAFMDYYVQTKTIIDRFNRLSYGALDFRKRLYWDSFVTTEVNIPDTEEQGRIADTLEEVDAVICACENEIDNLERQKKVTVRKIFSQEVRFKREDGSEYPKWDKEKLGQLCDPHARIGWQNLRTDEFLDTGDYYLITGTDFVDGGISFSTCHYIDKERFDMDKNIQVENGDILITKDGTIGKVAMISGMDKPAALNAGVFVLQGLSDRIERGFMYQYLAAPFLLIFAKSHSTGGTIQHLNQGVLVEFMIPIPCLEEQCHIADFLSAFDDAITAAKQELEHWKKLKRGLLQQMFA